MSERFSLVLARLAATIEARRGADPATSWSAKLIADPPLAAKKLAVVVEDDGKQFYMLEQGIHEQLLESLASQQFPLRAASLA